MLKLQSALFITAGIILVIVLSSLSLRTDFGEFGHNTRSRSSVQVWQEVKTSEGISREKKGKIAIKNLLIADSEEEIRRGLGGLAHLPIDSGMLFVFGVKGHHGIWMKEMKFPIDIIWLDEMFRIVDLKENARPETYPEVFTPQSMARYVLETSSGFVKRRGLSVGDEMSFIAEAVP